MSDQELLDLIDKSLPTDEAKAAQKHHQIERWNETIKLLEAQLETGEYYIVGHGNQTTRQEVVEAIAGYRRMIEKLHNGR